MESSSAKPFIAIACGGTGGHLFPGIAIGNELVRHGAGVALLVSQKEVDQHAVTVAAGMEALTLPAVGLTAERLPAFAAGFWKSLRAAKKLFRERPPQAVLGMGGFTAAPPVLAGKACGAVTFLHESNTIPGKANRWMAHVVDQCFVGFPSAAGRLHHQNVLTTGTPVRPQFEPGDPAAARMALGLDPAQPVLLIMGGSQGARGVNDLVLDGLPKIIDGAPRLQFLHLTGPHDLEKVRTAYRGHNVRAVVRPFLTEMELALGAATAAVSRAGASSLAELAAMRLPAVLVPYPTAADNHQLFNARALVDAGAALLLEQRTGTGLALAQAVLKLIQDDRAHRAVSDALACWHHPRAAELIAEKILLLVNAMGMGGVRGEKNVSAPANLRHDIRSGAV